MQMLHHAAALIKIRIPLFIPITNVDRNKGSPRISAGRHALQVAAATQGDTLKMYRETISPGGYSGLASQAAWRGEEREARQRGGH